MATILASRILAAQLLDDAFSDDMVGQAAEGLGADDIVDAAVDQFQHLTGQEPALTGLVSEGDDIAWHIEPGPRSGPAA